MMPIRRPRRFPKDALRVSILWVAASLSGFVAFIVAEQAVRSAEVRLTATNDAWRSKPAERAREARLAREHPQVQPATVQLDDRPHERSSGRHRP